MKKPRRAANSRGFGVTLQGGQALRSIAYSPLVGQSQITVCREGLIVKVKGLPRGSQLDGVKRGTIEGFSRGAARRLREALATLTMPFAKVYGVTLTVPWHSDDFEPLMDEWRKVFNRFGVAFRRQFPHSAAIFRNEVQRRGAPHIHAVCYFASVDIDAAREALDGGVRGPACSRGLTPQSPRREGWDASPPHESGTPCGAEMSSLQSTSRQTISTAVRRLWVNAVGSNLHGGKLEHFIEHGVAVDCLDALNTRYMFRYLCDHASKHKREQLGYKGKQWGIIGRNNLTTEETEPLLPFESPRHEVIFRRMLRKLTRYTINHSIGSNWAKSHPIKSAAHPEWWFLKGVWKREPPFGCVHKGGRRRVGVIFVSGGELTVKRVFDASAIIANARG